MLRKIIIVCAVLICFKTINGFGNHAWKTGNAAVSCTNHNNKLLSLLNLLCNTTQTTSITTRDACYGCFFRAGSLINGGQQQLVMLNQCATMYLTGTTYAQCGTQLALAANGTVPTSAPTTNSHCYTGYCEFVRCVRRINSYTLMDSCFLENLPNRDLSTQLQRIYFYTNVTSCILAKTRCSVYNPISGQLQQLQSGQQQPPINYYNSLQITNTGDIRLISFPVTISISDLFCSRTSSLTQSSYGTAFTC